MTLEDQTLKPRKAYVPFPVADRKLYFLYMGDKITEKLFLLRTARPILAHWLFSRIVFILFLCRILLLLRNNTIIQPHQILGIYFIMAHSLSCNSTLIICAFSTISCSYQVAFTSYVTNQKKHFGNTGPNIQPKLLCSLSCCPPKERSALTKGKPEKLCKMLFITA